MLADEARQGLKRVEEGEENTIGGWLAYGHALNEGRALFPGDREFGEWVALCQLDTADRHDRAASMWAAANADQFEEARQRGNPRTIRGIHAKWKEIEAERAEAERKEAARMATEADQNIGKAKPVEHPAAQGQDESAAPVDGPDCQPDHADEQSESASCQPEMPDRQPKPADPDPHAKLRTEFRSMTPEGQEEDWIGLRGEVSDLRKRVSKQRGEIADLKSRIKELTSDDDAGRKIGNLQRRLDQSEGRSKEHQRERAKLQRQVNAQQAEIKKLRQQLEDQEIAL
ncbi:hypothetical protein [Actibacterium sp. MT2.3-13A]|uniref:hypothetical protein n=1 Tax=Actibacterium sp. MT2.3-13A TaxID=2828332 RepID=UPI001BAD754A|nr:hypothetical protein [Actibacterium sp. MT2.3-13A]